MKNIHVLPTDNYKEDYKLQNSDTVIQVVKLGQLIFDSSLKEFRINKNKSWAASCDTDVLVPHNIYITSDEEIKKGDFTLSPINAIVKCECEKSKKSIKWDNCKKIILTDNQDLIKDGVQAIDDEFLEWFVKNPSCEAVEVDKTIPYNFDGLNSVSQDKFLELFYKSELFDEIRYNDEFDWSVNEGKDFLKLFQSYKIIIPKEEPKQETLGQIPEKQENCCTPIGHIRRYKDCIGCDRKPKKEKQNK